MTIKNKNLFTILLIPAALLSYDFVGIWFGLYTSIILLLISLIETPKVIALLNFLSLFIIFKEHGKYIIPETMISVLGICILSRLIQVSKQKEIELYPYFLYIGIFAIFNTNLYYLLYSLVTITYLLYYVNKSKDYSFNFKNINYKKIIFITLSTFILFIFFPRFYGFLPSANSTSKGEIGYSKEINNSTMSELLQSTKTAFYAEISKELTPELLYWRGRSLNYTDGFNWKQSKVLPERRKRIDNLKTYSVKMKYEQDFKGDLILLDTPITINDANTSYYNFNGLTEYRTYSKNKKIFLSSKSVLEWPYQQELSKEAKRSYLQYPQFTPQSLKDVIKFVDSDNPNIIIQKLKQYLKKNNFSYSLSPGKMNSMNDFLKIKKGFCTHYSALMAIIFRHLNIPSRIISGFQGGEYNELGNIYIVKSNDAHAWVEYFHNGKWLRIDPTSFVAPNRINFGLENALNKDFEFQNNKNNFLKRQYLNLKKRLEILNYQVSLFLDDYDRNKQNNLSQLFKMNLKSFFYLGPLLILFVGVIYYLILRFHNKKQNISDAQNHLYRIFKTLKIHNRPILIEDIKRVLLDAHLSKEMSQDIATLYQKAHFSHDQEALEQLKNYSKYRKTSLQKST